MESNTRTAHRQAWDAIPWVVAGSATAAEQALVEQHAAGCVDCRDELIFHRRLQAGMLAAAAPVPAAEPGLQRLWARIDQADGAEPARQAAQQAAQQAAKHAAHDASAPPAPMRAPEHGRWSRWLVAAVLVQSIGLAVLAGMLLERPRPADYQTLSRPAPSAGVIRLVPAPGLRVGELQALLARHGLQIVDASADGALLALAPRPGAQTPRAALLQRLRAEPGVLLAEPMAEPLSEPKPGP